jgi:hypothetical protein
MASRWPVRKQIYTINIGNWGTASATDGIKRFIEISGANGDISTEAI